PQQSCGSAVAKLDRQFIRNERASRTPRRGMLIWIEENPDLVEREALFRLKIHPTRRAIGGLAAGIGRRPGVEVYDHRCRRRLSGGYDGRGGQHRGQSLT